MFVSGRVLSKGVVIGAAGDNHYGLRLLATELLRLGSERLPSHDEV